MNLISRKLSKRGIDWQVNTLGASHRGGVWERIICSVRKILTALADKRPVSDECLLTLLTVVERILNSRPLTPLSSDHFNLAALSPNALLNGRLHASLPLNKFIKTDGYRKSWRVAG